MATLKDTLKTRLLDMIRSVKPAGNTWKIVVVDPVSVKVLSAACKMFDILEENVTVVETLTKKRQPYPNFEALYFLSPTLDSVNRLIDDFTKGGPGGKPGTLYAAAHIFFMSGLDDALFNKLTSSAAKRYFRTLKELYVDFIAMESQCFSLQRFESMYYLFSPDAPNQAFTLELDTIAKHLVSVCATLGEYPAIRYHRPDIPSTTARSNVAGRLASIVQNEMDNFCRLDPNFPPPATPPMPRATLLILDRTIDVIAPLIHEFTYQAMANDLLPLRESGTTYTYGYVGGNGEDAVKDVVLDEEDPLWVQVRHTHIAECINTLIKSFNQFVGDNKAAQRAGGSNQVTSLNDMKEMLTAIPQFQDLKAKFSVHISMAQECMNLFEKHRIAASAAVEQDMATGEVADGSGPNKNIVADMVPLLDDASISPYDKIRLLSLYIISKEGVQDEDRRKLLDHAQISPMESNAITNLTLLGVRLSKAPKSGKGKDAKKKDKKVTKKSGADDVPYELSRYVPVLKTVLEECAAGTLDTNIYPYTRELQPEIDTGIGGGAKKQVASLRSTKPTWTKKAADKEKEAPAKSGGRLIVFIAGGATYSEIRSAYEVSKAFNRDAIIGTTHIITSKSFINDLKGLRGGPPSSSSGPGGPPSGAGVSARSSSGQGGSGKSSSSAGGTPGGSGGSSGPPPTGGYAGGGGAVQSTPDSGGKSSKGFFSRRK